jgi:ABC-type nitrate/sulfonate/bicarbonate transport system substrate-binding protein
LPTPEGRDRRPPWPEAAAQAFLAGQNDAADNLRAVHVDGARQGRTQGKILATTLDYPMVLDTVGCTPEFLKANLTLAKALADSYFAALDLIKKDPAEILRDHGRRRSNSRRRSSPSLGESI